MSAWLSAELVAEVRARISLADLVGSVVALRKQGREHVGLCPFHTERSPSFSVTERKGFYYCFGCGAHGDAIDFLQQAHSLTFVAAVEELAARAGLLPNSTGTWRPLRPPVARPDRAAEAARKASDIARALHIWTESRPAEGTPVEAYYRARGLAIAPLPTTRYHPGLKHAETGLWLPCMIGAVQNRDGQITGIHRTFLKSDGSAKAPVTKAKKMLGECWGGAIHFAKPARTLAIGEGIETSLSVLQAVPELAVWAGLSLGNLAGAGAGPSTPHPDDLNKKVPSPLPDMKRPGFLPPDIVQELFICRDADGDRHIGDALVERAARRFRALGLTVRIATPPRGLDFNDLLMGRAAVEPAHG